MNKRESNKVNSFKATEEVMNLHQKIWSKSEKFVALFALISGKLKLVSSFDQKKSSKQPSSVLKMSQRKKLIDLAVKISKSAVAYADDKNDPVLEFKVKVTKSQLDMQKDQSLLSITKMLYELVLPFAAELTLLSATDMSDFKTQIEAFEAAMPKPQSEIAQKKTATANLGALISEINDLFLTLDKQFGPYEYTEPDFYNDYKNSRVTKDLKKVSKATVAARKAKKDTKAA